MDLDRVPPQRLLVAALLGGLCFQLLLGTSYVAATLDPLDASGELPIAVVVDDEGERGAQLLRTLQARDGPVEWVQVPSEDAAVESLHAKRWYGALVLPANFTRALESFATDAPHAALVHVISNPGASTSGSLVAQGAIGFALDAARATVREQALAAAELESSGLGALTLEQARFLTQPIHAQTAAVNAVPAGGAGGLAPTYLAMAAWIGGYLGSVALERFRDKTRLDAPKRMLWLAGAALVQGVLAAWLVRAVGLNVADPVSLALFLALATWMAYSVVSLFVDLVGLAGVVPAFAVLAFGLPAAGAIYPVEMLPAFYRDLHAWSPFTPLVEGLRTLLYAPHAGDLAAHSRALLVHGGVATLASLALHAIRARGRGLSSWTRRQTLDVQPAAASVEAPVATPSVAEREPENA